MIVAPATTLDRSHSRTFANTTLNEDQLPIPNPDEIRAVVTLTPKAPAVSGPRESNLVALASDRDAAVAPAPARVPRPLRALRSVLQRQVCLDAR